MAQQIQFIYLTQSEYDGLNPKDAAKLYFTSDSHRIYKGSDLYAATTFDQLNFSAISASSITVDGSAVSLVGHSHSMSDIDGLASAITAATSGFASESHTHVIGDIQSLTAKVSGLTSNKVTKTNADFTNLSADNADLTSISASTATFGDLIVTGDVTMSLSMVTFGSIMASDIQVDGTSVALVGHSHSEYASSSHSHAISDVTNLSSILTGITSSSVEKDTVTADVGYFGEINVQGSANLTVNNIAASAISVNGIGVALQGHGHSTADISGLETALSAYASSGHTHVELQGITSNAITKDTGTFTNLVVASASFTATNVEAEEISASTATFGDINVTGTATLSTTNVTASTLTAGAGSFTTLTVGGSSVALVGHTHPASEVTGLQSVLDGLSSTYASVSHGHAISDITNLSTILTGITESGIEKDTVTADIGNFRLLSVSGSANFSVNNVSANSVTVNGSQVALVGHTHSVADVSGLSTALSAYASASHSHAISDITNLQATLSGFASSGHTHDELAGITSTSISKANGSFNALTASTATFGLLNVTSSATFDITNLVADTITVSDLDLTGTLTVSSTAVSAMTVTDLSVTGTLMLNSKSIATQEYVQLMISQAIGQVLASAY